MSRSCPHYRLPTPIHQSGMGRVQFGRPLREPRCLVDILGPRHVDDSSGRVTGLGRLVGGFEATVIRLPQCLVAAGEGAEDELHGQQHQQRDQRSRPGIDGVVQCTENEGTGGGQKVSDGLCHTRECRCLTVIDSAYCEEGQGNDNRSADADAEECIPQQGQEGRRSWPRTATAATDTSPRTAPL